MPNQTLHDIVNLLLSRKRDIIKICGIVFIGAAVISLLLPNKYKATTTFYAASDDLSRPDVMFGVNQERSYFYGGGDERDRLISVSKSNLLFEELMKKHNLFEHYNIKDEGNTSRQKLAKKFRKNFEVIKNDLDALELSFIDKDPEFSAGIANDGRAALNSLVSGIIKSSQDNFIQSLDAKIKDERATIYQLNDSISQLRDAYQFYDSENQIVQISELVMQSKIKLESEQARYNLYSTIRSARRDTLNNMRARIAGLKNQIKAIEDPDSTNALGMNIYELNRMKPILQMFEGRYYTIRGELVRDEIQLDRLQKVKAAVTPALHLVEPASVPSLKDSPRRSILVIGAVLAAFIFYVLGIILMAGYKQSA